MREVLVLGRRGLLLRASVPETRRGRMRGLIRSELRPDEAMLLERARSVHTFGLRSPIAVALLDDDLVVRDVLLVRPRRLVLPRRGVRHVLELDPGADVREGDRLRVEGATRSRPALWSR